MLYVEFQLNLVFYVTMYSLVRTHFLAYKPVQILADAPEYNTLF